MTVSNAIKKLNKAGFEVSNSGQMFSAKKQGCRKLVSFVRNGNTDEITCVGFRHQDDHCDIQSDYCSIIFCGTITRAIKLAMA